MFVALFVASLNVLWPRWTPSSYAWRSFDWPSWLFFLPVTSGKKTSSVLALSQVSLHTNAPRKSSIKVKHMFKTLKHIFYRGTAQTVYF